MNSKLRRPEKIYEWWEVKGQGARGRGQGAKSKECLV